MRSISLGTPCGGRGQTRKREHESPPALHAPGGPAQAMDQTAAVTLSRHPGEFLKALGAPRSSMPHPVRVGASTFHLLTTPQTRPIGVLYYATTHPVDQVVNVLVGQGGQVHVHARQVHILALAAQARLVGAAACVGSHLAPSQPNKHSAKQAAMQTAMQIGPMPAKLLAVAGGEICTPTPNRLTPGWRC